MDSKYNYIMYYIFGSHLSAFSDLLFIYFLQIHKRYISFRFLCPVSLTTTNVPHSNFPSNFRLSSLQLYFLPLSIWASAPPYSIFLSIHWPPSWCIRWLVFVTVFHLVLSDTKFFIVHTLQNTMCRFILLLWHLLFSTSTVYFIEC